MILDLLGASGRYTAMHPHFGAAFEFLRGVTPDTMGLGRREIDGDRLYAIATTGPGKALEQARLEAHRRYADIHYLLAGRESMGWKALTQCHESERPYDEETDLEFFADDPALWFTVHPGAFVIFLPGDAHAPMVSNGTVTKIVVKVRL